MAISMRATVACLLTVSVGLAAAEAPARSAPSGASPSSTDPLPVRTADPRADSLVSAWIDALGGMETFHEFRSARYTLTTELYDPDTGRMRRARPRYVTLAKVNGEQLARIERWNWDGSHFIVQGFDGDTAWAYVDGEPAPPDQQDAREALYVCRDVFYWFSLPFKLRDPGVNLHYDGRDENGRHVVRVTFGEGVGEHQDIWWYLFDEDHTWPVEVRYQTDGTGTVNRLHWEGIRSADGYFYPARRVHVDEQDRIWKVLRISDLVLNPEVPPETFSDASASPWVAAR